MAHRSTVTASPNPSQPLAARVNQGAATTAATAYAIADSAQAFAPHDTPEQVETMLKNAKQWDDYQFFKATGVFP